METATPLLTPRDGLPEVTTTTEALAEYAQRLADGDGPIAVDAERASGYRYGQRAYLVQIRRADAGTALIDPVSLPDLSILNEVMSKQEWILHAASQDLPCLAEIGLIPTRVFDTELAGRLAGRPRVGLGPLVASELGLALEKGHSAADWSKRPLPESWLRYAALDVEVLDELRDVLAADLASQGKLAWAEEEFAAIVSARPRPPRVDPWRRTSGISRARSPRQLAIVREMWQTRDSIAAQRDIAPGRILPDPAIIEAAIAAPRTRTGLESLPSFAKPGARRNLREWARAITRALDLPDAELPPRSLKSDEPPPARAWPERDPEAAARLAAARTGLGAEADSLHVPVENLMAPDIVRRICWAPPRDHTVDAVTAQMYALGARSWQVTHCAALVAAALDQRATPEALAAATRPRGSRSAAQSRGNPEATAEVTGE
jgi:ribonuclease D